jgi:hypothetical protein
LKEYRTESNSTNNTDLVIQNSYPIEELKKENGVSMTNGSANGKTNGEMNGHGNGHTNGELNGHGNGHTNGELNGLGNGHTNGHC